jgi:hypothetical protein
MKDRVNRLRALIGDFLRSLRFVHEDGRYTPQGSEVHVAYGSPFLGAAALGDLNRIIKEIQRDHKLEVEVGLAYIGEVLWEALKECVAGSDGPADRRIVSASATKAANRLVKDRLRFDVVIPVRGVVAETSLQVDSVRLEPGLTLPSHVAQQLDAFLERRAASGPMPEGKRDFIADALSESLDSVGCIATVAVHAPTSDHAIRIAFYALERALGVLTVANRWGSAPNTPVPLTYLRRRLDHEIALMVVGEKCTVHSHSVDWQPNCSLSKAMVEWMPTVGLDHLCKPAVHLTDLEAAMVTSSYWLWQGLSARGAAQKVVNYFVAIESVLKEPTKNIGVTGRIPERVAWLLANQPQDCISVAEEVAHLYRSRGAVVHSGDLSVPSVDAESAKHIAFAVLWNMLGLVRARGLKSWSDLSKEFDRRKYQSSSTMS